MFRKNVQLRSSTKIFYLDVQQRCSTNMFNNYVQQICSIKMFNKDVQQNCSTKMFSKIVQQTALSKRIHVFGDRMYTILSTTYVFCIPDIHQKGCEPTNSNVGEILGAVKILPLFAHLNLISELISSLNAKFAEECSFETLEHAVCTSRV